VNPSFCLIKRISLIATSFRTADEKSSPRGVLSGFVDFPFLSPLASFSGFVLEKWVSPDALFPRPFEIISRILSLDDPKNKWFGLQHAVLSQVWHTIIPVGASPQKRWKLTLLDLKTEPLILNWPYPWHVEAFHGQHDSLSLVFILDKNRRLSLSVSSGICLIAFGIGVSVLALGPFPRSKRGDGSFILT